MTCPAALELALAAADAAGTYLRADAGRVLVRPGWAELPDRHRETLRQHKPELLALLSRHPRPDPDPVWFVRRNLHVAEVPAALAPAQRHVWLGDKVYHRLTPAVLAYLEAAIDARLPHLAAADRAELLDAHAPLLAHVADHFRPDQFDRALSAPPQILLEPHCPAPG